MLELRKRYQNINVSFGEWEKIPQLKSKTFVGLQDGALPEDIRQYLLDCKYIGKEASLKKTIVFSILIIFTFAFAIILFPTITKGEEFGGFGITVAQQSR